MAPDQVINCKQIDKDELTLLDKVENTYNSSFPEEERRAFCLVRALCEEEPRFRIYSLTRNREYVGFISAWEFEDFMYVEHFAIDESARNGGIGRIAVEQFLALWGKPVILEVELPVNDLSRRRIGFYERLGFRLDSHVYIQPSYREGAPSIEMRLMSYGNIDLSHCFSSVANKIYKNVYRVDEYFK